MAYRYGNRRQAMLFPQSIEEYVPQEAPVRAYDAFVEALDLDELGIQIDPHKVGCPEYDPKVMLKLLIYGYSYGIRSSRKLERETHYNLSFMWLVGGLRPDHKTIAEFRRMNKSALSKVLRQCARFCIKLDLIEGNTLFVDGSKIRGNAPAKNPWPEQRCQRHLERIDERIGQILSECDTVDEMEDGQPSLVRLDEELKDAEALKAKVKAIMEELESRDGKSVNGTDAECTNFKGRQGSHAGYNAQVVVDRKHGLIVSSDVVNENTDCRQFANQIEQAHGTLEHQCEVACADSGYCDLDELDKRDFRYDGRRDCYTCPAGEVLSYCGTEPEKRRKVYRAKRSVCVRCRHFGVCTNSRRGRKVTRLLKEELKERLEAQYEQADSQDVYRLRKLKVELVFGHIKRNLKVDSFLLRGLAGVRGEMGLLASCFNIARLITIIGVSGLVAKFGS